MSKAITGLAMIGGAIAMGAAAFLDPALIASPVYDKIMAELAIQGIAMEAGAIADALMSNRGENITTRQPAANRQMILGMQRVGGTLIYSSTTGSHHDQYNKVIVIAGHVCHSILGLYLDGRKVYWDTSSQYNTTRNGVNFGGQADHNDHVGPDGNTYNFGGLVFCEARFGEQVSGDVLASLNANDPHWATTANGNPYVGGCTYVYLKIEYDTSMFPSEPEIRFDVNGKCDIFDPRTQTNGFTTNWALIVADRMCDPVFGLGMSYTDDINIPQLIAAANVCDEPVELAGGGSEVRYACCWHGDTGTGTGDVISTMMSAAAGRISRIGGQWYIWPAYWQGPSFTFDENVVLANAFQWNPYRSLKDRFNRVTGTYVAPNFPYNAAGNLYDPNGWYDGTIQNNFGFAFQPTNFPQYAMDPAHGYPSDQWLAEDGGHRLRPGCAQQQALLLSRWLRLCHDREPKMRSCIRWQLVNVSSRRKPVQPAECDVCIDSGGQRIWRVYRWHLQPCSAHVCSK
ncbi:hypothetical protein SAMN05443244_0317 [Terriglobus roseus]|uniref:Uncharacterized protein n=1 Tax=Terriglobus roseus TaxID=392734 RepID=A0A1H4J2X2_9BACT|nr:hypothetical protein SAMN05443244_0317 [Terriglobus roseus]